MRWVNAMAERGHSVVLHSLHEPVIDANRNVNVRLNSVSSPLGYFFGQSYFNRLIREFKPDLIHSMHSGNYATLTRNIRNTPVLLSTWGGDIHVWPYRNPVTRYLTLSNLRSHRFQSATSENMVRDMRALRGYNYPVDIVPYGVDMDKFSIKSFSEPVNHIRLGAVKNLIPDSGLDLLILAFSRLIKDPDLSEYSLTLDIAGAGHAEAELKSLVDSLDLVEGISFLGQMPHDDVPSFMRTLDIFCSLSRRESFGVSIAEASATGLPVVATNIQGIPEIVEHEVTG
jgi:glycosyltransferase involved in cell wall biosynthesis